MPGQKVRVCLFEGEAAPCGTSAQVCVLLLREETSVRGYGRARAALSVPEDLFTRVHACDRWPTRHDPKEKNNAPSHLNTRHPRPSAA
eukprot:4953999-Pleurochrysis_carterae.AAC.1